MNAPEPMTPPDCDLRGMPYMPLDIVRLFDSDLYALATGDEFRAALTLWGKSFLQVPAASLPDDDRILAHLSGAGSAWPQLRTMALHGWVKCSDGRLYHQVVAEKAKEAWQHRQAQRLRTAAARNARAKGRADTADHADAARTPATTVYAAQDVTETATHTVTTSVTETVTGSKERESKEKKDTEALPPARAAPVQAMTARDMLWSHGLPILVSMVGKSPEASRTLLGKLLRDVQDDCPRMLLILQQAQHAQPADPLAWLTAAARGRKLDGPARNSDEAVMRAAGLWIDPSDAPLHFEAQGFLQ